MKKAALLFCMSMLCLGLLGSCMGISSEITIRRDGSGIIKLEYRISRELESLGKLDGNERWLPIPAGKADFERTVARIPGLTLNSFSTSADGKDIVNRINLKFSNTGALLRFLDASLVQENGQNRLILPLSGRNAPETSSLDKELEDLAAEASQGYSLDLSFSLPAAAELRLLNGAGQALSAPPAAWKTSQGGARAAFSAPIGDLILLKEPVSLEIRWPL